MEFFVILAAIITALLLYACTSDKGANTIHQRRDGNPLGKYASSKNHPTLASKS